MRTVDDLRAALLSLETEAPAADELLTRPAITLRPPARRTRTWVLVTATAGGTIAVFLAAAAVVALRSSPGRPAGAGQPTDRSANGTPARLLPFRLRSPLPELTLVDVQSHPSASGAFGVATVAEYGMEVTIDVGTDADRAARSASATPTAVGGVRGWIDVSCGLRDAQASAPVADPASGPPGGPVNPTCSLTYDSGPWRVAIYVAGPGGGSRPITAEQFLQIGDRLQLADSPADSATWFSSDQFQPR